MPLEPAHERSLGLAESSADIWAEEAVLKRSPGDAVLDPQGADRALPREDPAAENQPTLLDSGFFARLVEKAFQGHLRLAPLTL
jgi:hypothetical protein